MGKLITIALIGAGQLGSRHLQALGLLNRPVKIEVVEPFYQSVERAKERFAQIGNGVNIQSVEYYSSIEELTTNIDLVIIATNSDVRRSIIEKLVQIKNIRYLILEKVVFQKEEDFAAIKKLMEEKNIKAWVNCARRMWPFYQNLRIKLKDATKVDLQGKGSNWGLGCNAIHMLDLYAFITGETDIELSNEHLDNRWINSKRQGFVEFTGNLLGKTKRGDISLVSHAADSVPYIVEIYSDLLRCFVNESTGQAWLAEKENNWQWQEIDFQVLYQSQLTHLAVQEILDNGTCQLTSYEESWLLHIPLLKAFIKHINKDIVEDIKICPIT